MRFAPPLRRAREANKPVSEHSTARQLAHAVITAKPTCQHFVRHFLVRYQQVDQGYGKQGQHQVADNHQQRQVAPLAGLSSGSLRALCGRGHDGRQPGRLDRVGGRPAQLQF